MHYQTANVETEIGFIEVKNGVGVCGRVSVMR